MRCSSQSYARRWSWASPASSKANAKLRFSSEHDPLTGLSNRRYFNERVLAVDGGRPAGGCILLADLDHFKRINDTFGHPAGDAVLAAMSQRLAAALRENDKLVRWGGEEFLAVLGPMTPLQADQTAERLLHAVRCEPVPWSGQQIHCTISIGYANFPMAGAATHITLESAISLVDKALYEAKRRGRDRACLIKLVSARDEKELTRISSEFETATQDRRVHLVEIVGAAAWAGPSRRRGLRLRGGREEALHRREAKRRHQGGVIRLVHRERASVGGSLRHSGRRDRRLGERENPL